MKPNLTKYKSCSRAKGEIHAYKAQIFFTSNQVFQEEYAEAAKEDLKKKSNKVSLKVGLSIRKKDPIALNLSLVPSY